MAASLHAAAAAAAAAERILRPPAVLPVPGEGLRRLVHTNQHSAPARALEERYRGSQIQQKKEGLCVTSQLHRRPMTTAKKVTKWTAAALVGVAGAIAVGALATGDEAEDWPHCHRCGGYIPREYVLCGQNLPRHIAEAMQAASKCGQASGAVQNQEGTVEV